MWNGDSLFSFYLWFNSISTHFVPDGITTWPQLIGRGSLFLWYVFSMNFEFYSAFIRYYSFGISFIFCKIRWLSSRTQIFNCKLDSIKMKFYLVGLSSLPLLTATVSCGFLVIFRCDCTQAVLLNVPVLIYSICPLPDFLFTHCFSRQTEAWMENSWSTLIIVTAYLLSGFQMVIQRSQLFHFPLWVSMPWKRHTSKLLGTSVLFKPVAVFETGSGIGPGGGSKSVFVLEEILNLEFELLSFFGVTLWLSFISLDQCRLSGPR